MEDNPLRGMVNFQKTLNSWILKLPLFVLMLLVYSKSSVLTMAFLSIYGLTHGIAHVPRNRINAVKNLLHYGVKVLQHGLGTTIKNSTS
jgi:hypothetical protein